MRLFGLGFFALVVAILECLLIAGLTLLPAKSTTIAWDGTEFACDSQRTRGSTKMFTNHKIVYIPEQGAYIGGAGDCAQIEAFIEYFRKNGKAKLECLKDIEVIVVYTDGRCFYYCEASEKPISIEGPFAIGSGEDFAVTAMHCGRTASEAIKVAEELDTYTGGTIHTFLPKANVAVIPIKK
jgi:ATP-dependent protease HslVU (ClpYQ) peptidase subunit